MSTPFPNWKRFYQQCANMSAHIYVGVVYRTNESYCIEGKAWKQCDHEHFTQHSTPFDKFYDAKEKATMRVVLE